MKTLIVNGNEDKRVNRIATKRYRVREAEAERN